MRCAVLLRFGNSEAIDVYTHAVQLGREGDLEAFGCVTLAPCCERCARRLGGHSRRKKKNIFERSVCFLTEALNIDIPVKLAQIRVAFSVAALAFELDLPASIFHLQLITKDIADSKAKG